MSDSRVRSGRLDQTSGAELRRECYQTEGRYEGSVYSMKKWSAGQDSNWNARTLCAEALITAICEES